MARDDGFLTDSQRKYLRGEKDLEDHSNPYQFKRRIRLRVASSLEDYQLLQDSPHWDGDDFLKVLRDQQTNSDLYGRIPEQSVEQFRSSITAQSKLLGDGVSNTIEELEQLQNSPDAFSEQVEDMGDEFVRRLLDILLDSLGYSYTTSNELIRDIFEMAWPEKDRALEIVDNELSDM